MTESRTRLCLYDGDCGFCALCVRTAQRLDRRGRIDFVANHDASRWPAGVDRSLLDRTIVVTEAGRAGFVTRGAAVASLLRALPWLTPLAFVLRLPGVRWLADRGYDLVSRNRLRISAALGLGSCSIAGER